MTPTTYEELLELYKLEVARRFCLLDELVTLEAALEKQWELVRQKERDFANVNLAYEEKLKEATEDFNEYMDEYSKLRRAVLCSGAQNLIDLLPEL